MTDFDSASSRISIAYLHSRTMGRIGPREVDILINRIDSEQMTLQHLADEYGCSRQRIHQIEQRIRRALRGVDR